MSLCAACCVCAAVIGLGKAPLAAASHAPFERISFVASSATLAEVSRARLVERYGDHPLDPDTHTVGLQIPNELWPDYLDFAYFAFVIGMTFQVSDIEISSRTIRRVALVHGLLSFLFNTVIVALTINVVVDLRS